MCQSIACYAILIQEGAYTCNRRMFDGLETLGSRLPKTRPLINRSPAPKHAPHQNTRVFQLPSIFKNQLLNNHASVYNKIKNIRVFN
jgi:hypothetical protein